MEFKYLLEVNGRITQVETRDPHGRFNAGLNWIQVPADHDATVGWIYKDGDLIEPVARQQELKATPGYFWSLISREIKMSIAQEQIKDPVLMHLINEVALRDVLSMSESSAIDFVRYISGENVMGSVISKSIINRAQANALLQLKEV